MLFLTEDEVRRSLTVRETIDVLREAFTAHGRGEAQILPRWRGSPGPGRSGSFNVMAASLPALGVMGLKSYAGAGGGRTRFLVLLYSWAHGGLEAVLEADWLGRIRTGAASGLATDALAPHQASVLACLGAGRQAFTQIEAVGCVRALKQVRVHSPTAERREAMAREVAARLGVDAVPVASAREAVEAADVVTAITTASDPVLRGAWLHPGMHVNAAGSNRPQHRELDEEAVRRSARVVADLRAGAEIEAGDLIAAVGAGALTWDQVTDLGAVLAGRAPGRSSDEEITLFESQGVALEDVAAARRAVDNARRIGLGREIPVE